jgi:hypothetical protein
VAPWIAVWMGNVVMLGTALGFLWRFSRR